MQGRVVNWSMSLKVLLDKYVRCTWNELLRPVSSFTNLFYDCNELYFGTWIAQPVWWPDSGQETLGIVWFLARIRDLFLSERIHTGCGTHSVSYPIGTGASFTGDEAIGALKFATELHVLPRLRINRAITPVPYMPSWRAQGQFYLQ